MSDNRVYDMIVVGGGPGGYTTALYGARAGLSTLVLEMLSAGGQMALTAEIEESAKDAKENDSYYILRATKTAAVLVECGFLSNPAEAQLLNTEAYQKRIAWAIYCGIQNYFGNTQM